MKKRMISILLVGTMVVGVGYTLATPSRYTTNKIENTILLAQPAVGTTVVALGANNSEQQKQELLNSFGVSNSDENVMFISVTNKDIAREEFPGVNINNVVNKNSFSSVKITILPEGSGIQVSTNNLTQVTGNMLASVLTTCGINNASIVANSPMPVTGQAALAGAMMAFTKATGKVIPEQNKIAASNEIKTTSNIAKTVGQKKAEQIITQAKSLVIKDNPNSNIKVQNIVNNVVNNNGASGQLSQEQKQQLTNLMEQIKSLNLKESSVEKTLSNIQESIKSGKKNFTELSNKLQQEIQNNHVAIEKTENLVERIWHWITSFFNGGEKAVQDSNNSSSSQIQEVVDFNNITPNSSYNTLRNTIYGNVISNIEAGNVTINRNIQNQVINTIKGFSDSQIKTDAQFNVSGDIISSIHSGDYNNSQGLHFSINTGSTILNLTVTFQTINNG